ncbi:MAG: hypothetical protein LBH93_01185 [Chitinispirillales bacterium]|nr:hypothetical protein [Chitinispirillales bacterium]
MAAPSRIRGAVRPALAALVFALAPLRAQAETFVPASHPLVRYTGRFDQRGPNGAVRFDWPGGVIELRFGGRSCAVRIRGDGGYYDVFIDGVPLTQRFDTLETTCRLALGLRDTVHSLKIVKRFEGLKEQSATLRGFYIDAGKSLHPIDAPPPSRRIEFIGGSNLLGFGVEANTVRCDTPAVYSNAALSFGYAAARELGAECHIVAMSGKGLVRNWRSPFVAAARPFGMFYGRSVKNDSTARWDFGSWVPHVVAVCFGTNDFSSKPHPPKELFIALYWSFVQEVWARNPEAKVVCVTSAREPARSYVREFVDAERAAGNERIRFYSFGEVPKRMCGCDWHPNVEAQAQIGMELAEAIRDWFD